MSDTLLEVTALRTWIDTGEAPVRAVDAVDLTLARGETLALLGESGSGKSITALSLLRLLPENAQVIGGHVTLEGSDLLSLPERAMRSVRGPRVAMVFQEPMLSLNPVLRIGEQVEEVLRTHGKASDRSARRARVIELLQAVGLPDAQRRCEDYPFQLSGGMRQRVMIALALAGEPDLLVGDEPTTALDVTIQAQVLELLRSLQRSRGMAMLLITHDLGVVAQTAQRVAVMYAGEIVEVAPVAQFLRGPAHPYSRKLFDSLPERGDRTSPLAVIRGAVPPLVAQFAGCRFADRCDHAFARCTVEAPALRAFAGERSVRCHLPEATVAAAMVGPVPSAATASAVRAAVAGSGAAPEVVPVLEAIDLQVHFPVRGGLLRRVRGALRAVDGVSLAIAPGRTLALVGESGCGKTTVGKALLRLTEPTGGELRFDGRDLRALRRRQLRPLRAQMQIVFQDPYASLNPKRRIGDVLEEGMRALRPQWSAAERGERIDRLLGEVGLPPQARDRFPHQFSGGQRQRIAIARALSVEPRLIVCDEPTSALDVSVQAQILNLLRDLQRTRGLAYLFITHNLGVVRVIADDIAVMYLGRIVERGPVQAVLDTPAHPYTRALLSAVPRIDGGAAPAAAIAGDPPSPIDPPSGCHFRLRCAQASARCATHYPPAAQLAPGHSVRCHLYPPG